ncbi:MAG: DoxX family protein [Roseovarius sp.]
MEFPDILNLIGRLAVAFYFLWAVTFNIQAKGHHLAEFKRIGAPAGELLFWGGIALSVVGAALLIYTPTAWIGAALLIVFTLSADAMFHRYWTYKDPGEIVMHKFFLFEHVALVGGMIGLAAGTL